jgi:hypothetical protein
MCTASPVIQQSLRVFKVTVGDKGKVYIMLWKILKYGYSFGLKRMFIPLFVIKIIVFGI